MSTSHRRLYGPAFLKLQVVGNGNTDDVSGHGATDTATAVTYSDGRFGHTVMTFNGTTSKVAYGNIGSIRTIAFWVNPVTTTEELILVDTGKDIMVSAGTITYTGLTADATYVDGKLSTTLVAGVWQHVVCVLNAAVAATTFGLANDGTNYGACNMASVRAYVPNLTGDEIQALYLSER